MDFEFSSKRHIQTNIISPWGLVLIGGPEGPCHGEVPGYQKKYTYNIHGIYL